ncbi:HAD-IA family hydrolase [Sulfitobacter albidus]|uniref:HAD-IA family hydrolase n=1 Tax=Sulfitobacter albidus TaxID=2829501 RepID=A0A975PM91_9RHOB|nr:HAD-IA family hydrolase [Sulfitobacter albidus]QUJ76562.1 HAD-IA family hydrolase [Sulfitobacter albidus]
MKAILFGSLSVLVDTSELQRTAFNTAFREAGLDWDWTPDLYRDLLTASGGRDRIADYAEGRGDTVDVAALHARKSEIFQDALRSSDIGLRPVTLEMMDFADETGIKTAFVSTTSRENLDAVMQGFGGQDALKLALVTDADTVSAGKPDPAIYLHALDALGLEAADVIAVEDNVPGMQAAQAAGITCVVYPNQNTVGHDFGGAPRAEDWQAVSAA